MWWLGREKNQRKDFMSTYRATIVYNDGQDLYVDLEEKDVKAFSDNISNNKIFWNQQQTQGFLTDLKNIRYISFNKTQQVKNESEEYTPPKAERKVSGKGSRTSKR